MYANLFPHRGNAGRLPAALLAAIALHAVAGVCPARAQEMDSLRPASVIRNINRSSERIEMTVNTSQVLTLKNPIPRIQVTNPELLSATPLSKNEVQIAAKQSGVTQVNLWDESGNVYTVDIIIYGDVRELEMTLKQMFPESTIRAIRLSQSLVLQGQVDRPEIVPTISLLAEDYAPKVVNAITVGGVQQISLKVKVMEVSRTKLRALGMDWTLFSGDDFIVSGAAGILSGFAPIERTATLGNRTIDFAIVDGNTSFNGYIDALQQNNIAKVMADPILTTVSGRPASFNVGQEVFFEIGNGIAGANVQSERVGTEVNFVPIVLGNGRIRLEVRPKISEFDSSIANNNSNILFQTKLSEVDTGVEMNAGQTLALAGLVQQRVEAVHRGLPFLSDLPVLGIPFRRVQEEVNEIETLILVTPEYVDAMDPHEVPQCGPGMESVSPSHLELYCKGYIEVPSCGPCGPGMQGCGPNCQGGACNVQGTMPMGAPVPATDGQYMNQAPIDAYPMIAPETAPLPAPPSGVEEPVLDPTASWNPATTYYTAQRPAAAQQPVAPGGAVNPAYRHILNGQPQQRRPSQGATSTPGLIGPIGYDVQK